MKKVLFMTLFFTLFSAKVFADNIQYNIQVDGIVCPFCVKTSVTTLKKIDGVKIVSADLENGLIRACTDEKVKLTDEQLRKLFLEMGFTYRGMEKRDKCNL